MSPMSAPAGREIDLPLCQLSQYLACNQTGRTRPYIGYQIENGAPDRIRTCDLCLRRAALYPAELRVLDAIGGNRGGRLAKPARCRQMKIVRAQPTGNGFPRIRELARTRRIQLRPSWQHRTRPLPVRRRNR